MESVPSENWKHPTENFRPENGVYYKIYFLGSYPVNISIKTVEYKNRMKIARECIKRVSSELGIILPKSNKAVDQETLSCIGTKTHECNKIPIWLRITTETISMLNQQKTEELRRHNLQEISFACGGDQELLDYLSYVAKDAEIGRFCYVFQSTKEPAKDIIMTIGQAFDLRFREYQHALLGSSIMDSKNGLQASQDNNNAPIGSDQENEWGFRPISNQDDSMHASSNTLQKNSNKSVTGIHSHTHHQMTQNNNNNSNQESINNNNNKMGGLQHQLSTASNNVSTAPSINSNSITNTKSSATTATSAVTAASHCPTNEAWYFGSLSRIKAENLLKFDGDFLVRDSNQQPNQYVLSGKQNGQYKHLLLVDPDGRVHTKDREFNSIKHLVEFHLQNKLPIASVDSELHLLYPIKKGEK